ncbi:MAG: hypothetical protein FWF88_10365 [Peptococcaceae bacterium]|nr:hypothetical protein [Peptococcaceae bacterium]
MADMKLNEDKLLKESIKQFQSATGKWGVESLIGEGSFGKVYKIRRQEFGKTFYSAIKIISIPYDENEIRQMRNEGLNETSIRDALQSLVADIINEIEIMSGFRGNSNIVSYEDPESSRLVRPKDSITLTSNKMLVAQFENPGGI